MNKAVVLQFILLAYVICGIETYSQTVSPPQASEKTDFSGRYRGDIDGFLNRQAEMTLELVSKALVSFPPVFPEPFERRMALLMIDGVLNDAAAPERLAVQSFFHSRMELVLKGLTENQVEKGAMVWKLYNHGFIVRTPTVTVAFDLIRGYSARADGFPISDLLLRHIVHHCDVLFVSHRHGDHADQKVAETFIELGKPVVAPLEVWAGKPIHAKITHLKRDPLLRQELSIQSGEQLLEVVLYAGHQGRDIPNNVPLVFTPEGICFSHTGDQLNMEDFVWIDEVAKEHHVDVLMPGCWTKDIGRMIRGFDPELVITGHENELGRSVDHREPFWKTYDLIWDPNASWLLLTWGESFHYQRSSRP